MTEQRNRLEHEGEQTEGEVRAEDGSVVVSVSQQPGQQGEPGQPEQPQQPETGRRRRRTRARARTISIRRLSKAELNRGRQEFPEMDYWRPSTRGDCLEMERPCPYVACKYHLYIDVHPVRGSIKINFPDVDVWEMDETCALDIADRGGITLEEVGVIMNLTRERVRQLETQGLARLGQLEGIAKLQEYVAT